MPSLARPSFRGIGCIQQVQDLDTQPGTNTGRWKSCKPKHQHRTFHLLLWKCTMRYLFIYFTFSTLATAFVIREDSQTAASKTSVISHHYTPVTLSTSSESVVKIENSSTPVTSKTIMITTPSLVKSSTPYYSDTSSVTSTPSVWSSST